MQGTAEEEAGGCTVIEGEKRLRWDVRQNQTNSSLEQSFSGTRRQGKEYYFSLISRGVAPVCVRGRGKSFKYWYIQVGQRSVKHTREAGKET